MTTQLTILEARVLDAMLYNVASASDHDFGIMERVARGPGFHGKQFSALVTQLIKKGVVRVHETMSLGDSSVTQFEIKALREAIDAADSPRARKQNIAAAVSQLRAMIEAAK